MAVPNTATRMARLIIGIGVLIHSAGSGRIRVDVKYDGYSLAIKAEWTSVEQIFHNPCFFTELFLLLDICAAAVPPHQWRR